MSVVVHEPTITESAVECRVAPSGDVRRFFADDTFRAEYDVDVSRVPPAIAVVPVLAHVCPVRGPTEPTARFRSSTRRF
jgi:hypothetical protein